MKKYEVVYERWNKKHDDILDSFTELETDDLKQAIEVAQTRWDYLTEREKREAVIEIRTNFKFDDDGTVWAYDTIEWRGKND